MAFFTKLPITIEAITFDELVEHGRLNCDALGPDGMPWAFKYKSHPITNEDKDHYIITTLEGLHRFGREDMLVTGVNGEIYPCKIEIFEKTYTPHIPVE